VVQSFVVQIISFPPYTIRKKARPGRDNRLLLNNKGNKISFIVDELSVNQGDSPDSDTSMPIIIDL